MKLVWCPDMASKAYIDTVKSCQNFNEPGVPELLSAMAAGWNSKLIVETWLHGGPIATSVGLAVAASHTGGRHVCIVPDEQSRSGYIQAMRELAGISPMNVDPRTGQLLGTGRKVGHLFELNYLHISDNKMDTPSFPNDRFIQTLLCAIELESLQIPYQQILQVCAATNISPLHLWHSRLGHTSVGKLRPLISRGLLGSIPNESVHCVSCQYAKQPALSFSSSPSHSTAPFDLVHSDYHCFPAITSLHEPQSYQEASSNPLWQQAMQDELQALENTRTWDLVDLPTEKSLIGCKWVYRIKTRSDGSVERYKARLVAKGFTQEYGINYEETFAPIAHLTSVHKEEVYTKPPTGLHHPPNKFSATVIEFGFTSSPHDTALFIRKIARGMVLLLLYVDDMIITGDDVAVSNTSVDFLVVDSKCEDFASVLRRARLSDDGAVLACKNACNRRCSGFRWNWVLDRGTHVARSMFLPVGKGLDIAHVDANGGDSIAKKGPGRWIRHIDQRSGEEHIFRV
ncbi:hypothetical protein SLEP1_g2661 [Rubroshorea leprosula]|uniref:Reverse transcriptase Ty1/copia-type domain-containing protein n=1 Tax=Rubroshorea leprosula TaxID=152421 RepID=A0AAV5HPG2_9ROSI|nr:hypothetical protein SLEP1_g2661 [Rubroshorea leprosula]